jgi:hypothetical protein
MPIVRSEHLHIENRAVTTGKPFSRHASTHSNRQHDQIAASSGKFGAAIGSQ